MIKGLIEKINSNSLLKHSLITVFLRGFGVLILFGFTVFITNFYSPSIVGEYESVRVFLLVIGSIALLGTEQSVLYYAGKYQATGDVTGLKQVYFKMLRILVITVFLSTIIYLIIPKEILLSFLNNDFVAYQNIKKSFFILFFFILTLFNTEVLRALDYIYWAEIFRNILKYLPVLIGAFLLLYIGDPNWLVDFYIYGFVILSLLTSFMVFKSFKAVKVERSIVTSKEIIKVSYPMAISATCFFLMLSIDVFLLKKYFSNEQVAYYATAVKLLTVLTMVIVAINTNVSPKLAEFFTNKDFFNLNEVLKKSRKVIVCINSFFGIVLIVFGFQILSLFGENYVNAYYPMVILVLGQMATSFFGSNAALLNMADKQHIYKNILIAATVLNLILNLFLIPKYGMIGAASSFVASLFFWNIVAFFYVKFKILKTI